MRTHVARAWRFAHADRKRKIRILLVDDHPSVLAGVRGYLKSKKELIVVGHTGSGEEAISMAKALQPDVMIVDLSLPDIGGLDVIRRVRSGNKEVKFLVYTMHDGKEFVREANRAGANGFVSKAVSLGKLSVAIKRISRGKMYPAVVAVGIGRRTSPSGNRGTRQLSRDEGVSRPDCSLTERELEILRSLPNGAKLREIAADHCISFHTVVSHLRNIYTKLGVRNRSAAVETARAMGII